MLDLGPRASAAFWPTVSTPDGGGAGSLTPALDYPTPYVSPPARSPAPDILNQGAAGTSAPDNGSHSSSPSSGASPIGAAGAVHCPAPDLRARLRATQSLLPPPPLTPAIFEPPRRGR